MAETETLAGESCIAEVHLGDFSDEKEVIRSYPGLKEGIRFKPLDEKNTRVLFLRAFIDLCEFDEYILKIECLILNMEDRLRGMIEHKEMLQAGMFLDFPEMFEGETFVGYYGSLCEARKDYSLRTLREGDTTSFREIEVKNRSGEIIRKETDIDVAYFANCQEVKRMIEKEEWDILHEKNEIARKKEFLQRLKRIRRNKNVI